MVNQVKQYETCPFPRSNYGHGLEYGAKFHNSSKIVHSKSIAKRIHLLYTETLSFFSKRDVSDDGDDVFTALTQTQISGAMDERMLSSAECNTKTGTCLHFDYDLIIAYGGEVQTHSREPAMPMTLVFTELVFIFLFLRSLFSPFGMTKQTRSSMCTINTMEHTMWLVWSNILFK